MSGICIDYEFLELKTKSFYSKKRGEKWNFSFPSHNDVQMVCDDKFRF